MKANKAPEKLYVDAQDNFSDSMFYGFTEKSRDEDIEYTRTDAFIEKACEYWYKYNRDVVTKQCCGFTVNVEDFRKYMREE